MAMRRALERSGGPFVLHVAPDGIDGMRRLHASETRPDVLVLDLNMPRMNGLEFLAELRRSHFGWTIPVFVLTTGAAEEDRHAAYALGITGYVIKAGGDKLAKFATFLRGYLDLVEPP
jgi:CheY-like chemotaxis protein